LPGGAPVIRVRVIRTPRCAVSEPSGCSSSGFDALRCGQRSGFGYSAQTLVRIESEGPITTVILDRAAARNAVDRATAEQLAAAFRAFDADPAARVAVLYGDHGTFCAGADLKAMATGAGNRVAPDGDGPMGPSRMLLGKPVIAAIAGHAVAGGLELALWCDLRIAEDDAVLGVFCRRFGVPLIDGGTIRLSRKLGHSHALDLILTGRGVSGEEARMMGLANRLVDKGKALEEALVLANQLAAFPQRCLRSDRLSSYQQWTLPLDDALVLETRLGAETIRSGETLAGATRFAQGAGRHGAFER
jgi:enoyl-CoA hydratase